MEKSHASYHTYTTLAFRHNIFQLNIHWKKLLGYLFVASYKLKKSPKQPAAPHSTLWIYISLLFKFVMLNNKLDKQNKNTLETTLHKSRLKLKISHDAAEIHWQSCHTKRNELIFFHPLSFVSLSVRLLHFTVSGIFDSQHFYDPACFLHIGTWPVRLWTYHWHWPLRFFVFAFWELSFRRNSCETSREILVRQLYFFSGSRGLYRFSFSWCLLQKKSNWRHCKNN